MKKILTLLTLIIASIVTYGQDFRNGNGQGGQMPSATVYGKIVDSISGKGVDAATIQIYNTQFDINTKKQEEKMVSGMITNPNGDFKFENLPVMGQYKLVISGISRKTINHHFSFIDPKKMAKAGKDMNALLGALDKDLGNIRLALDNQTLTGVTVSASKPTVQLGIDRKIYNVENNLTSAGGTATDVLKTVPSVNVDIDGNVSVRNASPQIFVDGRPTTLTLDQIPADQISSVEVITNPSAKYDASGGTAGILNIVLKKTKTVGYSGSVRAGIDQRGKYNFGGNLNIRQGKFNVFGNIGYNQRKSISTGTTDRSTFLNNTTTNLHQTDKSIGNGRFLFARGGFDYFLSNRSTITLTGMTMDGKFKNNSESDITVDSLLSSSSIQSFIARNSDANFHFNMKGAGLGYVHNFPKSGHQFTMDGQFNKSKNNNINLISNKQTNAGGSFLNSVQQQNGDGNNQRINLQADYSNPLTDKSKLEAGVKFNQTKTSSNNIYNLVGAGNVLIPQPLLSSIFDYKDQIYAAYTTFSSKIGDKFGYQIGLRMESSDYNGTVHKSVRSNGSIKDSVSHFSISYPISLFPSVFLSQDLGNDQQLQLNYSRRINRPGFFQLFPFIDYSDSLNLSRGNPNLKPEFTNSVELSYSKNFDRVNNLLLSVYYKNTNGLITRYQSPETNPNTNLPILVNTYINANSSFVGGFEAVSKNAPTKWWDLTSNLNIYTSKINIDDPAITTAKQLYSWYAKINNTFKLPQNFSLQLTGDYNSKTVLPPGGSAGSGGGGGRGGFGGNVSGNAQGYTMPSYGVDFALKYEFLKNKAASVTLNGSDIFKTRKSDIYTSAGYMNQHQVRIRDQRFFSINFAYRFGKFDMSLLKRKNMKADQEGMQGGMQGMPQ